MTLNGYPVRLKNLEFRREVMSPVTTGNAWFDVLDDDMLMMPPCGMSEEMCLVCGEPAKMLCPACTVVVQTVRERYVMETISGVRNGN